MYEEYRKWEIHWCSEQRAFEAISPDYEPTWTGEDGGWLDGERFTAPTLHEVYQEIDERVEEQARQLAEQAIQRAQASLRASRKDPDA